MNVLPDECWHWAQLQRTDLKAPEEYFASLESEYDAICDWFPPVGTVLDIGGGQGGFLTVMRKAGWRCVLMDGDGECPRQKGYGPEMSAFNSTEMARRQFAANGVTAEIIPNDPMATVPADLIVSLLSWGFHYPLQVYAGLAERSLPPGGRIIADIRQDDGSLDDGFREIGRMTTKYAAPRVCYERL